MNFPDLSGSGFMRETVTMAAWLNHVTSLFLLRESAYAARRVSACLLSGSNRLIRQSAFLKPGHVRQAMNGSPKSTPILERICRSPKRSLMPSFNCLETISKPFLGEIMNTIRGYQILAPTRTIYVPEQTNGGLA